MKKIDLHSHTNASDGIYSPSALIDLAIKNDISVLVIADHDTVDGIEEALQYAEDKEITIIPAIEYSVEFSPGTFHLLGMFVDHKNNELITTLKQLSEFRNKRAQLIVEDLVAHNIKISMDEVVEVANGGVIGKPHIARVLVNNGYADSVRDVFKKYLEQGMPGHVPKKKIELDEAIRLTQNAGGITVLAHPGSLGLEKGEQTDQFVQDINTKGVCGIEVYSEMHNENDVEYYMQLAKKFDMVVTGGSDFHGDKNEKIGYYAVNKPIPVAVYDELVKYIKHK